MSVVQTIIGREYVQRVRTRTFIISTAGAPIILFLFFLVPHIIGARSAEADSRIAVLDRTAELEDQIVPALEEAGYTVERIAPASRDEEALEVRLVSEELAGVLILDQRTLDQGEATWRGGSAPSTLRRFGIEQAVSQVVLMKRLGEMEEGAAVVALLAGGRLHVARLSDDVPDESERTAGIVAGFAGAFILYMVLLVYGTAVLRAVLEEKTGRIVEVIISSVRPWQLMLGKIMGVGAVGLTQLAIFVAIALLFFAVGVPRMGALFPEMGVPSNVMEFLPGYGVLAYFFLCFFIGYFLYASLFAAVGAMCATTEEAQQIQMPVVLLVVAPVVFLMPMLENPDSTMAVSLSLFPFFSPILMFARVAAGAAPLWQASLSVVFMLGALGVTAWVAGRIYRTGILMQGKRPTLPELWRWIRVG